MAIFTEFHVINSIIKSISEMYQVNESAPTGESSIAHNTIVLFRIGNEINRIKWRRNLALQKKI